MMQFFRKYTKQLLAVFMALLLVVWLGGSALSSMLQADRGGYQLATTKYGEITGEDQMIAQSQTTILEQMNMQWRLFQGMDLIDWIVMSRESDRLGSPVSASQVSYSLSTQPLAQRATDVAHNMDIKRERVAGAVSRQMQIGSMLERFTVAMLPSEAEVRQSAKKAMEKVRIAAVSFPVSAFKDHPEVADATFSDAELQAQFDEYKDKRAGQGMNFGYMLEPRVKVQYIKIDAEKILDKLHYPEKLLRKRAWSFWKDNKTDQAFKRPPEEPKKETTEGEDGTEGEAGTEGEEGAGAPTEPETPKTPYFEDFAEAENAAIERVKLDIAKEEARKMADRIANALWQPWEQAESMPEAEDKSQTEPAGPSYMKAPDTVKSESYLNDELARIRVELRYPDAITVETSDWFTRNETRNVEGIGLASTPRTSGPTMSFAQAAFLVEGIVEYPTDPNEPNRNFYATQYQPGASPMQDRSGNWYVYRIIGAEGERVPDSLAPVRDRVVADLRTKKAVALARQEAEELLKQAKSAGGLKAAWEQVEDPASTFGIGVEFAEPRPFARREFSFGQAGLSVAAFISNIGLVGEDFTTACFNLADAPDHMGVLEVPSEAKVVAVQWLETIPISKSDYLAQRNRFQQQIRQDRSQLLSDWLSSDNIRARNGVEYARN